MRAFLSQLETELQTARQTMAVMEAQVCTTDTCTICILAIVTFMPFHLGPLDIMHVMEKPKCCGTLCIGLGMLCDGKCIGLGMLCDGRFW